jgi:hypothetical protein
MVIDVVFEALERFVPALSGAVGNRKKLAAALLNTVEAKVLAIDSVCEQLQQGKDPVPETTWLLLRTMLRETVVQIDAIGDMLRGKDDDTEEDRHAPSAVRAR